MRDALLVVAGPWPAQDGVTENKLRCFSIAIENAHRIVRQAENQVHVTRRQDMFAIRFDWLLRGAAIR